MDDPLCIYCTATQSLIDFVHRAESSETALKRLSPSYGPSLIAIPWKEASKRAEEARVTAPVEITLEQFDYHLNVLPPVAWVNTGDAESFKMSERLIGNITCIIVRLGSRYFRFHDNIRLPHGECCQRVQASQAYFRKDEHVTRAATEETHDLYQDDLTGRR